MTVNVTATETPVVEGATVEAVAPTEAQAGAAVEVAAIEADRDVAIATIAAGTAEQAIAAQAAADNEDDLWLRDAFEGLSVQLATLSGQLQEHRTVMEALPGMVAQLTEAISTMALLLTPPPPSEAPPPAATETPPGGTEVDGPRASPEGAEGAVQAPASAPKRQRVWLR